MASSSFCKCFVPSADASSLNLQNDNPSSPPERGLVLLRNAQSLPMPTPTGPLPASFASHHDSLLTARSGKGMVICSFAIAATTAIGLSFCSLDCVAVAAELEVNNTAIVSAASAHGSPNIKPTSSQDLTLTSKPSIGSVTNLDHSFSMAIPIPDEDVWGHVQNGFIAPLPHNHEHGMVLPFSQPRKTSIASEGSTLKCPRWTPSELEMVLPDFHGRPKPFPHQGHHWSAAYVTKGANGEAFLQLVDSNDEVELDESDGKAIIAMEDSNKQQQKDKLSLLKVLGMGNFTCFSM